MKNSMIVSSLTAIAVAALLAGCSSLGGLKGTEEMVEDSGKRPRLISKGQWFDEKGKNRLYVGFADQVHDLDIALRSAELEAKKHLIESIATDIRVEGTRAYSGPEKEAVGRFFEDAQSWVTDNVRVSGATLLQTYWEKWARSSSDQIRYYYRGFAVVQLSKADYEKAKVFALDRLIEKAMQEKNAEAEKAARQAKERLLDPGESNENQ